MADFIIKVGYVNVHYYMDRMIAHVVRAGTATECEIIIETILLRMCEHGYLSHVNRDSGYTNYILERFGLSTEESIIADANIAFRKWRDNKADEILLGLKQ